MVYPKYQDNGQDVSWDQVQQQYGIGQYSAPSSPPDKYNISDGGISQTAANGDKHDDFYEDGKYLFSLYQDPKSTGATIKNAEGAQGLEDFTSFIARNPDLALLILKRANANGWDASASVIAAIKAGVTENGYKKFWDIASFTPWGAFYDENAMKGKQRDFIGLASDKVDFISKIYTLFTDGSLQYDISHGTVSTPPKQTTDDSNVFQRIWDVLIKGITDFNNQ